MDLNHLLKVFDQIRKGEIEIARLETGGVATPVARVGIERISMKTDLIPPEKMKRILVESAKARLLNEVRAFICTNRDCAGYSEMLRIQDLPDKPACPKCGAPTLGVLSTTEDQIWPLVEKKGEKLTKNEQKIWDQARETAKLIAKYGKPAAVALAGRRLKTTDAADVLSEESHLSDHFFELVMEAERKALKRRF